MRDRTYSTYDDYDPWSTGTSTITITIQSNPGWDRHLREIDRSIRELERSVREFAENLRRAKAQAAALAELIGTDHPVRDCRESVPDLLDAQPGHDPSTPIRGPPN
jgi:hypothetical protein